jgi:hypothetical protein
MKLLKTLTHTIKPIAMKVYKNTEWLEYVVKPFVNGKCSTEDYWYFTDDKEDANDTAAFMLSHAS